MLVTSDGVSLNPVRKTGGGEMVVVSMPPRPLETVPILIRINKASGGQRNIVEATFKSGSPE